MTLKANELDKYKDLSDLLDGWIAAANNLGAQLVVVQFETEGNGRVQFSLTDASTENAYWEIS